MTWKKAIERVLLAILLPTICVLALILALFLASVLGLASVLARLTQWAK